MGKINALKPEEAQELLAFIVNSNNEIPDFLNKDALLQEMARVSIGIKSRKVKIIFGTIPPKDGQGSLVWVDFLNKAVSPKEKRRIVINAGTHPTEIGGIAIPKA